jgi:hypothetical protein
MGKEKREIRDEKEERLIQFLRLTKDGTYASVESDSIPSARAEEETVEIDSCQEMYYWNLA